MKQSSLILIFTLLLRADIGFEEWQRQENQAFVEYQTQMDRAFIEMLKREWKEYHSNQVFIPYHKPKPHQQPTVQPKPKPQESVKVTPYKPTIKQTPTVPKKEDIAGFTKVKFDFFGIDIEIRYNNGLKSIGIGGFSPEVSNISIANFWNKQSSCNYQTVIDEIKEYQNIYSLDGWATYLLVKRLSEEVTTKSDIQNLVQWFILVKLGIDAKVGFSSNNINLLIYSNQKIYVSKYFIVDGKRYYSFNNQTSGLQIYKENMQGLYAIEFLNQQIKLPYSIKNREVKITYHQKEYIFNIAYNQKLIDFYKTYPQLNYNRYSQFSTLSQSSIHQQLQPIIRDMNKIEAINFLLRFTQNGFNYKRDIENFGKEKVLFFEETLAYNYSDCEDRAIFFAILVRELLHLDMVFIKYPNHLATAIQLNSDIKGEKIVYKNRKYYIADPTYTNADIGQAMPQLKGQKIKIIE